MTLVILQCVQSQVRGQMRQGGGEGTIGRQIQATAMQVAKQNTGGKHVDNVHVDVRLQPSLQIPSSAAAPPNRHACPESQS